MTTVKYRARNIYFERHYVNLSTGWNVPFLSEYKTYVPTQKNRQNSLLQPLNESRHKIHVVGKEFPKNRTLK